MSVELSIVIPTANPYSPHFATALGSVNAHTPEDHEVIVVWNASPLQGYTAPVNTGIRSSLSPYIVVMNDDVEVAEGWWPPLKEALDSGEAVACPTTLNSPHEPIFPGWCWAISRLTVECWSHDLDNFLDPQFVVYYSDTDLSTRLDAADARPRIVRESRIWHGLSQTIAKLDYAEMVDELARHDEERFHAKHPDVNLTTVIFDRQNGRSTTHVLGPEASLGPASGRGEESP